MIEWMNAMSESPRQYHHDYLQATIDTFFRDNTQIRVVKEQSYPFTDTYTEYEAYVDSVADATVAYQKEQTDFIEIMFKDIDHTPNVRGQKYLYAPDEENYQTYLCYSRINQLTQTADFKCVRCNNYIKWINSSGQIVQEPIYLGYELSSTNNQTNNDGTVPQRRLIVYMQGNDNTKEIILNQRFMLSHKRVFKVTEINDYAMADTNTGDVTMIGMYIEWSALLPSDNTELNICSYGDANYSMSVSPSSLNLANGSTGVLTGTVTYNSNTITMPLTWLSSDTNVVTIDSNGNYKIVGSTGDTAVITCTASSINLSTTVSVTVVATPIVVDKISITPTITSLTQYSSQAFTCTTTNGEIVLCSAAYSGSNNSDYTLTSTSSGYTLINNSGIGTTLTLTFTSGSLTPVVMAISLVGLL